MFDKLMKRLGEIRESLSPAKQENKITTAEFLNSPTVIEAVFNRLGDMTKEQKEMAADHVLERLAELKDVSLTKENLDRLTAIISVSKNITIESSRKIVSVGMAFREGHERFTEIKDMSQDMGETMKIANAKSYDQFVNSPTVIPAVFKQLENLTPEQRAWAADHVLDRLGELKNVEISPENAQQLTTIISQTKGIPYQSAEKIVSVGLGFHEGPERFAEIKTMVNEQCSLQAAMKKNVDFSQGSPQFG